MSNKQGHSDSIFPPQDSDSLHKKIGLEINSNRAVGEPKENTQESPVLQSKNDMINTGNGNRAHINKTGVTKDDSFQFKQPNHPPPDTPYFIPDPTNPNNWL